MQRLQQERTMCGVLGEGSSYQPPWRTRKFFLLDGHGRRMVFVDENYLPENFDNRDTNALNDTSFPKQPTACLVSELKRKIHHLTLSNLPQVLELFGENRLYLNRKFEGYSHLQCGARANPSKIDPRWTDTLEAMPNNPFESYYKRLELRISKQQEKEEQREKKEDFGVLCDLPVDVLETIISKMDGISLLNFCKAFQKEGLDKMMWEAMKLNSRRFQGFWFNTVTKSIQNQMSSQITTSYYNLIHEKRRQTPRRATTPYKNVAASHNCEEVCRVVFSLMDKLARGKVSVKSMTTLEEKVKSQLQLYYNLIAKKKPKPVVSKRPIVIVDVNGSLCFYAISPWNFQNLVLMEDLDKCEERHLTFACENNIRFIKTMYLPTHSVDKEQQKMEKLPEIERLIITSCDECTHVRVLQGDVSGFWWHHPSEEKTSMYHRMEPIITTNGNFIVVWHDPDVVHFYKLQMDETRKKYEPAYTQKLHLKDGYKYWNLQCNYTQYFIPVLVLVKNNFQWEDQNVAEVYGEAQLTEDFYELQLINMRFGNEIIGVKNSYVRRRMVSDGPLELRHNVEHVLPEYFYHNAKKYRSLLEIPYSGAHGYDVYVFWNHQAIAVSWITGIQWHFLSWKKAVEGVVHEVPSLLNDLTVTQISLCARKVLAAMINGNLVLFKIDVIAGPVLKNMNYINYQREPEFVMTPMRIVAIDLMKKGLFVQQMTYSFDQGNPYFFLIIRKEQETKEEPDEADTDFYYQRICFEDDDEEVEDSSSECETESESN